MANAPLLLIGCGRMGGAILRGLQADPNTAPGAVVVVDPHAPHIPGATILPDMDALAAFERGVVLIAVKPGLVAGVLAKAQRFVGPDTLFISIAAGIGIDALEAGLGGAASVIRIMPNTPAAVLKGMSVAVAGRHVRPDQKATCEALMRAIGDAAWLQDESLFEAVTALSGSGPAYFFRLGEALSRAGQAMGLPPAIADQLARRTLEGAGALAAADQRSLADLRIDVTSPGGTTAAALKVFDAVDALDALALNAMQANAARSKELGG